MKHIWIISPTKAKMYYSQSGH